MNEKLTRIAYHLGRAASAAGREAHPDLRERLIDNIDGALEHLDRPELARAKVETALEWADGLEPRRRRAEVKDPLRTAVRILEEHLRYTSTSGNTDIKTSEHDGIP